MVHTIDTAPDVQHVITPEAAREIQAMQRHAALVEANWQRHRPDLVTKMYSSLATALAYVLTAGFGSARIMRDGRPDEMSLYVSAGITYGVICRNLTRADVALDDDLPSWGMTEHDGRYCFSPIPGGYCATPIRNGERTCTGHDLLIMRAPNPVEWTVHS